MTAPKIGRYRLFDKAGLLWRCRLCGKRFKKENRERHFNTEREDYDDADIRGGQPLGTAMQTRLALLMAKRRSRRNLRRARWEYKVGRGQGPS